MKKTFVVWVGGIEVNNHYLSKTEAEDLALEYRSLGYDDVIIEDVK